MIKNVYWYPLFLLNFNNTWIFSTDFFFLNPQISNFLKIRPVEAGLFHADGRTGSRADGRTEEQTWWS